MGILLAIFWQAPAAVWYKYFRVDNSHTVYGRPAQVVGLCLMYFGGAIVLDVVLWSVLNLGPIPPRYMFIRVWTAILSILVAAFLCWRFKEEHRSSPRKLYDDDNAGW